jgi:uncharacterized protein with ParB-like and HNH nuclease domain
LNDRGLDLSDADIFKAKIYNKYSDKKEKADFIETWKQLDFDVLMPMKPFQNYSIIICFTCMH